MNARLTWTGRAVWFCPSPFGSSYNWNREKHSNWSRFEDHIVLHPVRGNAPLRKKRGIWVLRAGALLKESVVDETIRSVRKERELEISSRKR